MKFYSILKIIHQSFLLQSLCFVVARKCSIKKRLLKTTPKSKVSFLYKVVDLRPAHLLIKHRCFPMDFVKLFRTILHLYRMMTIFTMHVHFPALKATSRSLFILNTEDAVHRFSSVYVFLKISQYSQENNSVEVSF